MSKILCANGHVVVPANLQGRRLYFMRMRGFHLDTITEGGMPFVDAIAETYVLHSDYCASRSFRHAADLPARRARKLAKTAEFDF